MRISISCSSVRRNRPGGDRRSHAGLYDCNGGDAGRGRAARVRLFGSTHGHVLQRLSLRASRAALHRSLPLLLLLPPLLLPCLDEDPEVLLGGATSAATGNCDGATAARASVICCMVGRAAGSVAKQLAISSRTTGGASSGTGRRIPDATLWITCIRQQHRHRHNTIVQPSPAQ